MKRLFMEFILRNNDRSQYFIARTFVKNLAFNFMDLFQPKSIFTKKSNKSHVLTTEAQRTIDWSWNGQRARFANNKTKNAILKRSPALLWVKNNFPPNATHGSLFPFTKKGEQI